MKPSPRDSAATRKLLNLLNDKATGRLEVGAGGSKLSVYVLHGEVVAAVCVDDDRQFLHLLRLRGEIDPSQAERLETLVDDGDGAFGEFLNLNPSSLDELLAQRFRQNLCDYVSSIEKPTYAPQKGVFVDNIQMGHESRPLVEACCAFATKAMRIDPDQLLVRGPADPRPGGSADVAALLTDEPQSVYSLTLRIPMEPTAARCLLVDLVTEGVAAAPGAFPVESEDEGATEAAIRTPAADVAPEPEDLLPEPEGLLPEPEDTVPEPEWDDEPVVDDSDAADAPHLDSSEPEPAASVADASSDEDLVGDGDDDDGDPDVPPGEAVAGEGVPRSLAAWLNDATRVDDDELDFFSDHDHDRGSDESGNFSTKSHNLDTVDVTDFGGESEILEAEEAPSAAKFSSPILGEDAAEAKIDVANDMLGKIVAAFDQAEGPGAGQSAVQLMVDGSPPKFVALLSGLIVDEDGTLPVGRVMANLYSRPASEHRKLINDGMLDLMERALSKAADELPDELFDEVYEGVAGYKQRLGL